MTRIQFWILSSVAILLVAVLWTHFIVVTRNGNLNNEIAQRQQVINQARQLEPVLDSLAKRIAKGSDTDPKLKNILAKHGMKVTLDVDGKKKNYP